VNDMIVIIDICICFNW